MAKDAYISTNPAPMCQPNKLCFKLLHGNNVAKITSFRFKTFSCLHVWLNDKDPSKLILV